MAGQKLSRDAFDRLQAEFDDLTTRGRIEIAQKIEAARELGDLSENGDYHAAKEEQGKMEGRIAQLTSIIDDAEIIEVTSADVVAEGCVVGLRYEGDDELELFLIGSIEEQRDGVTVMSPGSPMGKALLGAKEGQTVSYEAPGGVISVTIHSIEA